MKIIWSALVLCLVASHAWAQAGGVTVETSLDQDQFLANEDIYINVRVVNFSGRTLNLGEENNWLTFYIEGSDNFVVQKFSDPSVQGTFTLESSKAATKRVNIAPHFNLQKPGRYRVKARIKVPDWNQEITSGARTINIISGTKLQVLQFGVPSPDGTGTPEVRKYILQQAEYLKEMRLYLRVTDVNEAKVFKVFPLARLMSFSRPDAQLDRFNNLHVLHQIGQRSFNYCVVNPHGQIMKRQTHDFNGDSRPKLKSLDDGRIEIQGGIRRVTETDLPPEEPVSLTEAPAKNDTDAQPSKP